MRRVIGGKRSNKGRVPHGLYNALAGESLSMRMDVTVNDITNAVRKFEAAEKKRAEAAAAEFRDREAERIRIEANAAALRAEEDRLQDEVEVEVEMETTDAVEVSEEANDDINEGESIAVQECCFPFVKQ